MKTRVLGKNLTVSAVGLGCMGMSHAYGAPADKEDMKRLIAQAVDLGVTMFDTAECYGSVGPYENEELVGEALKPYRNRVVLATKFGVTLAGGPPIPNSRPEVIRKSVEGSLKRLQTDCIDLYYQHRVDPDIPMEEVAGIMQELMNEGKIRYWGLSEASEKKIRQAHAVCPVTALQSRYSMLERTYEKTLFPVLEELGIGFVAFSPLGNGFLTDRYTKDTRFTDAADFRRMMPQFTEKGFQANAAILELLRRIAAERNATPAQISLAWMISKKPYIVPIPGTRKPERLAENCKSADIELSASEIEQIDKVLETLPPQGEFAGAK